MTLISTNLWRQSLQFQQQQIFRTCFNSWTTTSSWLSSNPLRHLTQLPHHRNVHSVPRLVYKGPSIDQDQEDHSEIQKADERLITVPVHLRKRLEKKMATDNSKYGRRMKILEKSREGNKSVDSFKT